MVNSVRFEQLIGINDYSIQQKRKDTTVKRRNKGGNRYEAIRLSAIPVYGYGQQH